MKKNVLIIASVLILGIIIGVFIRSFNFSYSDADKKESFELIKEICEENLEIGNDLEKHIEVLEKFGENTFKKEADADLGESIHELRLTKNKIEASRNEQENKMYSFLYKYTDIDESVPKTAFDSYISAGFYIEEAYNILIPYDEKETKRQKAAYEDCVKKAKRSLKTGRVIFEKYYNICR